MALDWAKVREIFDRAAALPAAEREALLERDCGADAELRAEIEALLQANEHAGVLGLTMTREFPDNASWQEQTLRLSGRRIGPYELQEEIGRGGMGVVFRAVRADGEFRKRVAIKLLRPGTDAQIIQRFRQERQILAELEHPNIARLLDGGKLEGMPYVVMEFVEGQSLRSLLKERGALPPNLVIDIARQVASGLAAAHQRGIIHRDIKPENLIVITQPQGQEVKILDFGIARFNDTDAEPYHTQAGLIFGTAAYMSPEQASGMTGEQIDARTDVYSLGMVVYELLTGGVAFAGDNVWAVVQKVLHEMPVAPSKLRPTLPNVRYLDKVVLKALAKEREQRQPTVSQFAEELTTAWQRGGTGGRRRWLATTLIILLLGLAFIAGREAYGRLRRAMSQTQTQTQTGVPPVARAPVYRVIRRNLAGGTAALVAGDVLHEGELIHFEFDLPFQGALYLFFESQDGALIWANPQVDGSVQKGADRQTLRIPETHEITMGRGQGPQHFWAVYKPDSASWTLADAALPDRIVIRTGEHFPDARLAPATALRVKNDLDTKAVWLTSDLQAITADRLWRQRITLHQK